MGLNGTLIDHVILFFLILNVLFQKRTPKLWALRYIIAIKQKLRTLSLFPICSYNRDWYLNLCFDCYNRPWCQPRDKYKKQSGRAFSP